MTRTFMASEAEAIATFWQVYRRDGVTLGFTSHDRDLRFGGIVHRAAPGMLPSAVRRSRGLDDDAGDVTGALSHDSIAEADLAAGLFDEARIIVGVVDWETLETAILYRGSIGEVSIEGNAFSVSVRSQKAALASDPVPRTSPTCRAMFCGPECGLSANAFSREATVTALDLAANAVGFSGVGDPDLHEGGEVRWIDGPHVGRRMPVYRVEGGLLVLGEPLDPGVEPGMRAMLREGCDHTVATCADRFANSVNFRGEPFLPGNDVLIRYPTSASQ